jgi:MerR family transcriptional regulator, thiopeptide resistance regulator
MKMYTVRQLARLSRISVRTLHYYDEIGLLKPARTGENGYRYYGQDELLRLQQILLHRELGLPLEAIGALLREDGNRVARLREHRERLAEQIDRYRTLIATLDHTIEALEGRTSMDTKKLYAGFSPEKQAEYERWLIERGGEAMREGIEISRRHLEKVGDAGLQQRIDNLAAVEAELAAHCRQNTPHEDAGLHALLARHRDWVSSMWGRPCPATAYAGLASLYETHPDFRARYETLATGLADYLPAAMRAYSRTVST